MVVEEIQDRHLIQNAGGGGGAAGAAVGVNSVVHHQAVVQVEQE